MMSQELEGIRRLRSGTLYMIIVPLLLTLLPAAVALGFGLAGYPMTIVGPGMVHVRYVSYGGAAALGALMAVVALGVVSLVLMVMSFANLREGFSMLTLAGKGGLTGSAGVLVVLVGILIVIVGALLSLIGGLLLIMVGLVIIVVGYIFIGVGFFEVGSSYNNGILEAGGILVAIPLLITSFIGLILCYIGLGEVESKLSARSPV
jgi:uncharacterized membrane protein